ncbi:MAG: hypothetical protein EXS63_03200 [Candidatus Omnitrophica bacterium]|nr:hypothetical protein [Candidatus Omnitrophota bacterium]
MVQPKPTPEEQLLKLIENPGLDSKNPQKGKGTPKTGKRKFSLPGIPWGKLFSVSRNQAPKRSSVAVEDANPFAYIKGVNAFLIAGVLVCGIYLALDLSILKGDPKKFLSQVSLNDSAFSSREGDKGEKAQHDVKYYHDMMARRNPFMLMTGKLAEKEEAKPEVLSVSQPKSDKMAKIMQSIKLVGISWTNTSPLAMIEQTESGKTYFLKRGQEINGLKVQNIEKEKVTVTYEGEEASLF